MDITALKQKLADFQQQQRNQFHHSEISDLLHQRSDFYDELLTLLWQQFGLAEHHNLALLAVGGYGRREMFPLSDLDILVISDETLDPTTQSPIQQLFNLLWDSKLQLGTAVRTLDECITVGKHEISVATNMFESRFLVGNKALWQTLMTRLYQPDFWAISDFFYAKQQEKHTRYTRYHNTSYNLEPDLKHSPGGLRDLHLMSWIMLRQYGVHHFDTMCQKGIIYPEEYHEIHQAQAVLFRMRFALHLQLKRYDNRLRFDRQLQLSELLGYEGEGNHPVEMMMRDFYQATQSIVLLSQLVLDAFEQNLIQPLQKKGPKYPLDEHYFLRDSMIFCHNQRIFVQQPHIILDLFFHLTQHASAKIATITVRQLRLALQQLTQPLSELPKARQRFIQLFSQPNCITRAIVPMYRLGVLSAYLPQWREITGLMQFDMFHLYTVDEHTIRVLLKLEGFLDEKNTEMHPLCCKLMPQISHKAQLYLAGLFHDIAKGRSGDHAKVGAIEMRKFALQHKFTLTEADEMAWLVAEHLTMSITAQRRDIYDSEIIKQFAHTVQNTNALSALTCLTVADICATNETLWNDWKRALFIKLFQLTETQLQQGEHLTLNQQYLATQHQQQAYQLLTAQLSLPRQAELTAFWQPLPQTYFMRNSPTQLMWHALHYLQDKQIPMILVSNQYSKAATEIFIYAQDQSHLFTRLAYTLSQKKITIHDAQIITTENGFVLDSFIVTEISGKPLSPDRIHTIQTALKRCLIQPNKQPFKLIKTTIKHRSFKQKTTLRFLANSQQDQTAFELFTLDREGLLAQIGQIFNQLSLNLLNAKITTVGERVEDFFVVTNAQHHALSEQEKQHLTENIIKELVEGGI